MEKGDHFDIRGYDLVAMAKGARGGGPPDTEEAIVLNNNSSHFLVAHRATDALTATFLDGYYYIASDEPSIVSAYLSALSRLTHWVATH